MTNATTTKTLKIGKNVVTFDRTETRGVLAGAYIRDEGTYLTHLVFCLGDDARIRTGCRQPVDNMADSYSPGDHDARPTCPTCAKRWDKIQSITA